MIIGGTCSIDGKKYNIVLCSAVTDDKGNFRHLSDDELPDGFISMSQYVGLTMMGRIDGQESANTIPSESKRTLFLEITGTAPLIQSGVRKRLPPREKQS